MGNRTKREILRAFNELMTQRPIDKISVDDICEAADISRSTFYRQFRDKYDVLTYNFQKRWTSILRPVSVPRSKTCLKKSWPTHRPFSVRSKTASAARDQIP